MYLRVIKIAGQQYVSHVGIPEGESFTFRSRVLLSNPADNRGHLTIHQARNGQIFTTCIAEKAPLLSGRRVRISADQVIGALQIARTNVQLTGYRARLKPPRRIYLKVAPNDYVLTSSIATNQMYRNASFHLRGFTGFSLKNDMRWSLCGMGVSLIPFTDSAGHVNTELRLWHIGKTQTRRAKDQADIICALLSFAISQPVRIARFFLDDGTSLLGIYLYDLPLESVRKSVPQLILNKHIQQFVNVAYPTIIGSDYPLKGIIELLVDARSAATLELRALLLSNVLEMLRNNYLEYEAVADGSALVLKGNYVWTSSRTRAHFEDALKRFCHVHKIGHWRSEFKDIRNSIVHEGRFPKRLREKRSAVARLQFFCEYAALKLLSPTAGIEFVRFDRPNDRHGIVKTQNTFARGYQRQAFTTGLTLRRKVLSKNDPRRARKDTPPTGSGGYSAKPRFGQLLAA